MNPGSSGIETISWADALALGGGFDIVSHMSHLSCLQLEGARTEVTTPGGPTDFQLKVVDNSASLAQSLSISAEASFQMGVYSGDAKASFAAETKTNSSSLYVVASAVVHGETVQYPAKELQQLKLTPESAALLTRDPWAFHESYGTHFVVGQVLGGELYCVVEITTSSTEEQMSLTAQVSGSGDGITGKADFTGRLSQMTSGRNINVWIHKVGGTPVTLKNDEMTVSKFVDMVGTFPDEVAKDPTPRQALIAPYGELAALNAFNLSHTAQLQSKVGSLVDRYLKYRDALADVEYLENHLNEFVYPVLQARDIQPVRNKLEAEQQRISDAITAVTTSADGTVPATVPIPLPETLMGNLPQRRARLPKSAFDIHKMYPDAPDGEYDIYMGGKLTGHVVLYCHDMKSGMPSEYVTLHSANNYSEWPASYNSQGQCWRSGTTIRTAFQRIRIDPSSGVVDVTDQTFSTTVGGPLQDHGADTKATGPRLKAADYATASASNHDMNKGAGPADQDRQPFSTAKVDLSNTGLQIADGVVWRPAGWDVRPSTKDQEPQPNNRHVMTVSISGAPGICAPVSLQLVPDGK